MTPWWNETTGNLIGGVGLGGLGSLTGCLGAAIGVCAPRGIGRRVLVGAQLVIAGGSLLAIGVGIVAVLSGQPRHVHYPLLLGGSLLSGVLGGLIPITLTAYRVGAAHRAASAAEKASPAFQLGMGMLTQVMRAYVDTWGPGGPYRRWSMWSAAVAGAIALFATAALLASWGGAMPGEQLGAWVLLALMTGCTAIFLVGLAKAMAWRATGFERMLDQQRLAAEELRRG